MLQKLIIKNFRCFQDFELQQLGRINLLVGENNSGKTSILEAINLLYSGGDLRPLTTLMANRGEFSWHREKIGIVQTKFAISHLFHNHNINLSSSFSILGITEKQAEIKFNTYLQEEKNNSDIDKLIDLYDRAIDLYLDTENLYNTNIYFLIHWSNQGNSKNKKYKLVYDGDFWILPNRSQVFNREIDNNLKTKLQFISSSSLKTQKTIDLFNQIVLTPEEEFIYQALRNIEPNLERIAPIISEPRSRNENFHGGFVVKLSNMEQRIPIGSMGDGIWRILGLTLALVSAKNGVLLVDEIDTGLHYSTLEDMWKLIWETAKKLNVQVFATTHNSDCWTSLASLANREDVEEEGISIQRIEKGKNKSVVFTSSEIAVAAERGIEVR